MNNFLQFEKFSNKTRILTHFDTRTTQRDFAPENILLYLAFLIQIKVKGGGNNLKKTSEIHRVVGTSLETFRRARSDGRRPWFQDKLLAVSTWGIKERTVFGVYINNRETTLLSSLLDVFITTIEFFEIRRAFLKTKYTRFQKTDPVLIHRTPLVEH